MTAMLDFLMERVYMEPMSGCWLWTGKVDSSDDKLAYARASTHSGKRRPRAHRAMWTETNGPIPAGMQVLHRCDVRTCINPGHLFLGTNADNVADKVKKNRTARGAKLVNTPKLTPQQVFSIRREYSAGGTSHRKLGRKYGVSNHAIGALLNGRTWWHLTGPEPDAGHTGGKHD